MDTTPVLLGLVSNRLVLGLSPDMPGRAMGAPLVLDMAFVPKV